MGALVEFAGHAGFSVPTLAAEWGAYTRRCVGVRSAPVRAAGRVRTRRSRVADRMEEQDMREHEAADDTRVEYESQLGAPPHETPSYPLVATAYRRATQGQCGYVRAVRQLADR